MPRTEHSEDFDYLRSYTPCAHRYPHFKDCAQVMLRLGNGGGVLGDISYLAADGCCRAPNDTRGFPPGWRFTVHGPSGSVETYHAAPVVMVSHDGETYVLNSTYVALLTQNAADEDITHVSCPGLA